jgi:predicted Zn finger-like uncharacterized protein
MDVGCPKCQTEYELEDDRVSTEGVTVKCTTCGHVFRVKRPVELSPVRRSSDSSPPSELPPPPPSREWKIRQPSGNVYSCRELTTLQKWIIENKVTRDDEISLSGETWKRLGNIPELASFFQIVEDAAKARAYEVALRAPMPSSPSGVFTLNAPQPPPPPPPSVPQPAPEPEPVTKKITETWREPQFSQRLEVKTEPGVPSVEPFSSSPSQANLRQTMRAPSFSTPLPEPTKPEPARPAPPRPSSRSSAARSYEPTESQLVKAATGGGGSKVLPVLLLLLAGGGAAAWYFLVYEPGHQPAPTPVTTPVVPEVAEVDAGVPVEVVDAGAPDAGPIDAGAPDAGPPDAGAPDAGPPDAGVPDAGAKKVVPVTFAGLLAQADYLRDNEKAEAALNLYGRAAELKPERAEPLAGRGLALLDLGNAAAAQVSFEQALALNPRYGPAIMGLAEAFRLQGRNAKAVEFYQRYLDVLPEGTEAAVARNNIERLKK